MKASVKSIVGGAVVALCVGAVGGSIYGERSTRAQIAALPTQTPVVVTRTVVVTPTPLPGQVQAAALAALPTGLCVVGMPDEDMRIAASGHGAQQLCRELIQSPRQGIGPLFDNTSGTGYDPVRISLFITNKAVDGGRYHLYVACQYSLPHTTVRMFDDPGGDYGSRFCATTIDGITPVKVDS